MLEIGRTKVLLTQNGTALGSDVRRIVDSLAAGTKYRLPADTTPTAESIKQVLKADVLGEDLWSLSDLFYGEVEGSSRAP
jgi:hypothetical protein